MKSKQELFNAVWAHVVAQGEPAFDEIGNTCYYHDGETGLRCAIGGVLPKETAEYLGRNPINASDLYFELDGNDVEVPKWLDRFSGEYLEALQSAHDLAARRNPTCGFIESFKSNMREVAHKYRLTIPPEA